jgi:hypothetical protein
VTAAERERDDLRARVIDLTATLGRMREVMDLELQAAAAQGEAVGHLLKALEAKGRVDDLHRSVVAELGEALAGFERPGHPGQL